MVVFSAEFNYTFKWVDDGAYGFKNKDSGEWNGLMGELLAQVPFAIFIVRTFLIEEHCQDKYSYDKSMAAIVRYHSGGSMKLNACTYLAPRTHGLFIT
jgi:hypothetical protein